MLVDNNSTKPIFQQIAEFIEDQIIEGELAVDDQVHSTNHLSKMLTINPATARKGLNILLDQGIIYKKRGVGMFVAEEAKAKILEKRKASFFEQYIETMMNEAEKLHMDKDDIVHMIESFYRRS
jgi:DNA-binding transcriptional regulator YhcF (GntR family)